MPKIAHIDDPISHGGRVIAASDDVFADGRAVARVGDIALCRKHGRVRILTGSSTVFVNGRAAAVDGSKCSCGASVLVPNGSVFADEN